jgi:predicted MFS family arabinose efflux permease
VSRTFPRRRPSRPSSLERAWRQPGFRRFWAARTISQWGDTFNSVALVILVYRLTGSGLRVGGTVVFEVVPVLVFGFVAGAMVDRLPRRRVMVAADVGRAVVAGALAVSHTNLAVIYGAAFALSGLTVFFNPAASSVVPALVGPDNVVGANSAVWSAAVLSQIVLAPVAGALVAFAGAGPAFGLNAVSYGVSACLLVGLTLPAPPARAAGRHLADIAEGLRAIRHDRFLRTLAAVQGVAALSAGATSALLVVLAERRLHLGAGRFGLLIGAIGVGAGLGPLVLHRLVGDVRHPGWLFGPYLLRGAVDLTLAASTSYPLSLGALAVYGVGTSTGNVTYNSVLQTTVPDRLRGRVFAFFDIVWQSGRMASIVAGGLLADRLGIAAVYWLGAGLLVGAALLGLVRAGPPGHGVDDGEVPGGA